MGTIFNGSCRVFQIHDDSLSIIDSEYRIRVITQIRSLQKCVIEKCLFPPPPPGGENGQNIHPCMEEEEEKEELYFFVGLD